MGDENPADSGADRSIQQQRAAAIDSLRRAARGRGGMGRGSRGGGGSWDDLVGKKAGNATKKINEDRPELKVVVVPEGSMVTMDMRMDRIRLWVDSENRVTRVPRVG